MRSLDRLRKLIEKTEWVKGAVNHDEDLHFSSFYLRASHVRSAAPLYQGYTSILAFFSDFAECYYLPRKECQSAAETLVQRALREPNWLPGILDQIRRKSDELTGVFDEQTTPACLSGMNRASLLALYAKHARRQRALNRVARLPEALDRGVSYFSTYLREHLRKVGMSQRGCDEAFATLAEPAVPSVLAQEIHEFDQIVQAARTSQVVPVRGAAGRARMSLPPEILRRLETHRNAWQFLVYHGYGRRELASLSHFIERLFAELGRPDSAPRTQAAPGARRKRDELLQGLRLDRAHQALFELYPEIGAVKLYRRYAQLRNFFYLDMLLAEIAQRLDVSEWTLRCMLPEEVSSALKRGSFTDPSIAARTAGCLFALLPNEECVLPATEANEWRRHLQSMTRGRHHGNVLHGTVACQGTATGPCKIVIRADDVREEIAKGTIIVSESTDPDLIGLLRQAAGVLTEQGGVTAHAAVICRELGVPTIIGIDGLLDRIADGDIVEVDANRGRVVLGKSKSAPPPRLTFSDADIRNPARVGAKAHNLGVVRSLGFSVPDYVVVDFDGVRRMLDRPTNGACQRLLDWTHEQLGAADSGTFAVRSSALAEDRDDSSQAGAYHSLVNVDRTELVPALSDFIRRNGQHNGRPSYRGGIIIQRMIEPEYAGVCLTLDPRTTHANSVIIELTCGGNQHITNGTASPERLVVDRATGDILADHTGPRRADLDIADMLRQFLTLEAHFGQPLDIEWAWLKRRLFILQARPIVHHAAP